MGNYVDASDITTWPSACDAACEAEAIAFAEELVEKILHRHFYPKSLDLYMNGNGKNRLFPPLHADLLTVEELYICGILVDPIWYSWDKHSVYLDVCKGVPESGGSADLYYMLTSAEEAGLFPRGYNNVRIIGTYGSAIPEPLKKAIIWLIDAMNDGSFVVTGGFKSESIGKYSYQIGATGYTKDGVYTGITAVDKILRQYMKQRKIVIMTP